MHPLAYHPLELGLTPCSSLSPVIWHVRGGSIMTSPGYIINIAISGRGNNVHDLRQILQTKTIPALAKLARLPPVQLVLHSHGHVIWFKSKISCYGFIL